MLEFTKGYEMNLDGELHSIFGAWLDTRCLNKLQHALNKNFSWFPCCSNFLFEACCIINLDLDILNEAVFDADHDEMVIVKDIDMFSTCVFFTIWALN
jgi:hypothetical protein